MIRNLLKMLEELSELELDPFFSLDLEHIIWKKNKWDTQLAARVSTNWIFIGGCLKFNV
jgi:hypothetical protein